MKDSKQTANAAPVSRRSFLKVSSGAGLGIVLGTPALFAEEQQKKKERPPKPKTNFADVKDTPRGPHAIPGLCPGKVVEVHDEAAQLAGAFQPEVIDRMFRDGIEHLADMHQSSLFKRLFKSDDIVGIKVNPVGAGIISTRLEVVDAIIRWLTDNGLCREQIVIWDRFNYMMDDAGFTQERFPGVRIESLQILDETAFEPGNEDDSAWLNPDGTHKSFASFDQDVYYWADVEGPQNDKNYLNQHVVNGKHSYFGKLVTQELTKIINVPVFKNTGNGVSMALKNLGYACICNTGRLHRPLFFDVCTEVVGFPAVRDKLVLNVLDGLRAQYDGGPGANANFIYDPNRLYLATDPFALDHICHRQILAKRKEMKVKVNENPLYTDYLYYGEKLGLGIADLEKIEHIKLG